MAQTAAHEGSTLEQSVPEELHSALEERNCMKKEWQIQNTECYEWTTNTVPHPCCAAWGGEMGRRVRSETEPETKGGERVILVLKKFSLSYCIFNWQ